MIRSAPCWFTRHFAFKRNLCPAYQQVQNLARNVATCKAAFFSITLKLINPQKSNFLSPTTIKGLKCRFFERDGIASIPSKFSGMLVPACLIRTQIPRRHRNMGPERRVAKWHPSNRLAFEGVHGFQTQLQIFEGFPHNFPYPSLRPGYVPTTSFWLILWPNSLVHTLVFQLQKPFLSPAISLCDSWPSPLNRQRSAFPANLPLPAIP